MSAEEGVEQLQYDSDKDFQKPKDEFTFYQEAFKIEEKKMIYHIKFEQMAASYWDEEMTSEISQEWIMDSRGQQEMTQHMLTKVLFRVAHWWATNIDLDEYIDLLTKIFQRITYRRIYEGNGNYDYEARPMIYITFPLEEKKLTDAGGKMEKKAFADEWLECRSEESNKSSFDYKYEEDPENMVVKKYKRAKQDAQYAGAGTNNALLTIKEPFVYSEDVVYQSLGAAGDGQSAPAVTISHQLTELSNVFPFGYPTEQFLRQTKEEVYLKIKEAREQSRQNFLTMTKEEKETEAAYEKDKDPGLLEENGVQTEIIVYATGLPTYLWDRFRTKITDSLYNTHRKLLRDGVTLTLRMYSQYPKVGQRTKSRSSLNSQDPITEVNKFGYNPALERRVTYKMLPVQNYTPKIMNVNYMIVDPDYETAYRSDVNRIETRGQMAIKDSDEIKRDEDFNNVETPYKKVRQIMLFKKFETIFNERSTADNKEQKRLKKLIDKEEKRRYNAMKPGNLAQKGLSETYEEKSFIKMMRGPFYQLDSREGLLNDDFYTCAEQDLIEAAKTQALKIFIIGKPRSGKTLLAKNLALKLDLVHINIDNWLQQLLTKIKNYEPPEDLEEGAEPPKFLSDLEDDVYQALQQGSGPSDEQMVEIIRQQIHSPQAVLKGFILDLSYYQREQSWANTIRTKRILGETPDGKYQEFSHIIELWVDDEDVKLRAKHMRVNPDDGNLYSRWEREERKQPKVVVEGEEEQEEDENAIKPLDELALVKRPNDMDEQLKEELHYYNTVERPAMEELLINFYDNQYIKLDAAGLTPDEMTDACQCKIKPDDDLPLRPLAVLIEGGAGDFKSLLSEGLEENQLPRKWSLWKQTDPVALADGKVTQGLPEYACHYNGNVFVFASEENLKAFLAEPKKFIHERPSMPSIFRILMLGAKGTGKHVQAQMLSDIYGWKVVDFKQLVRDRLEEMMRLEIHIPNNPMQGGRIGLAEQELQDVVEGKAFPAWKFIPWILDNLGCPLEKRKPPPPEEKQEDPDEDIDDDTRKKREAEAKKKAIEEERKRKEEEEQQRIKDERRRKREEAKEQGLDLAELGLEESEEEPIIIDDLSVDQLVLKVDEETGKAPFVGGFILIGFPETEEQITRLKAHGIEFDKIISLSDTNEEEPGVEIKKRMNEVELFDYDWEMENSARILNLAKEHLGEDNVREISCNGDQNTVFIRLRNEIDPFYLKIDNSEDVRVSADLGEEDKKLPKGDFGDYCPVTYVSDNWLVRGNPEQEVTVFGKTYWLAGEKEAELFKFNPKEYLLTLRGDATLPLLPPPPKIMIMGHRGSGVTTVQRMLCDKFKLEEFNLKQAYLDKLKEEKEKRKRRRLLDRGFRPPLPAEEEGMEPPADPEIEDDPEDFDREGHERQVMKMVYDSAKGYVIDGTWRDLPEGAVGQTLQDLLFESRRVPEIVIILKCKEQSTFKRIINFDSIKAEYDRLMEARANERKRQREEDREKFLEGQKVDEEKTQEDIEQEIAKWEEDRDAEEEAADENDPEKPNYEEMVEKEREVLREGRTTDDTFFEEFSTVLKDKQVFVIDDIKSDTSADFVFIKLQDRIKDNFQFRKDLIERQLSQPIKPEEVKYFEKSYIFKHSKYGVNSPLSLSNPTKSKKHAVVYRERIYFLANEEHQTNFLKEPAKYTEVETIPLDVSIKPKIFVIGLTMSGKSTLCKKLVEKTGLVHLKMSKIIQDFMDKDSVQGEALRKIMKIEGRAIEDDLLVNLLLKRIQLKDCQNNGFALEDFPKTRNQALYLAKRGLVPSHVFFMRQTVNETHTRTQSKSLEKFGCMRNILSQRMKYFQDNTPHLLAFYQKLYNNVIEIDSTKSKWFIEDKALSEISKNLEARQNFSRDYYLKEQRACKIKNLNIDRSLLKQAVSEFRYFCPVTWRNDKLLVRCHNNPEDTVLYKNSFFYFKTQRERDMFISNPSRFMQHSSLPKPHELPFRTMPHKAAEIILNEKALNGHCSVTLMDEERVNKGDSILLIVYKDIKYTFATEFKLQRFLANPFKYSKANLPVKMPPPEDKVSLYNLQRMEDSIAFMEQALGQIVTRGLREVSDNRLKYPTISVKETMLKLFSLFLKTENPSNTESMKRKYAEKMKQFIQRCELPEEIFDLAVDKGKKLYHFHDLLIEKKKPKDQWPEFKENYYNDKGAEYDRIITLIQQEKADNFNDYIR